MRHVVTWEDVWQMAKTRTRYAVPSIIVVRVLRVSIDFASLVCLCAAILFNHRRSAANPQSLRRIRTVIQNRALCKDSPGLDIKRNAAGCCSTLRSVITIQRNGTHPHGQMDQLIGCQTTPPQFTLQRVHKFNTRMWTINLNFKQTPVNWHLNRPIVSFYSRYGPWISGGISGRGLMYESTTSIQAILLVGHHRQIIEPFSWYELPDRGVCRIQGPWFGGKQVGRKRSWKTSRQSRPRSTDHYLDVKTKLKKIYK